MTNTDTRTVGSTMLTWAMIAGAALLFLEFTVSSMQPVAPPQNPTVQATTVAPHSDRVARN